MRWLIVASAIAVVYGHSHASRRKGNPACPCLTQDEVKNKSLNDAAFWAEYPHVDGATRREYGIGCHAHDSVPPYLYKECDTANKDPLGFCLSKWCYVSKDCLLTKAPATSRTGLQFSYATCGYVDAYKPTLFTNSLQGSQLKVVRMTNSGGWKGSQCNEHGDCHGSVIDLFDWVFKASGASGNVVATFHGGPLQDYPDAYPTEVMHQLNIDHPDSQSTFQACVYATSMGFVDVCLGAFSMLPERLLLSPMVPLYAEPVILVTTATVKIEEFWDYTLKAFKPFERKTWGAVMLIILFMSFVVAGLEHISGKYKEHTLLQTLGAAVFLGFKSFVDGASAFEVHRPSGRIASLGLGFFLLLTIAAYTANLATFLLTKTSTTTTIGSWEEILAHRDRKVCGQHSMLGYLTNGLRLPPKQFLGFLNRDEVLPNVENGRCVAAAIHREDFDAIREGGHFCNLMEVGVKPIFNEDIGVPVSDRAAASLQHFSFVAKRNGVWIDSLLTHRPIDSCADHDIQKAAKQRSHYEGMTIRDLAGPFAVSGFLVVFGVVIRITHKLINHSSERLYGTKIIKKGEHEQEDLTAADIQSIVGKLVKEEVTSLREMVAEESRSRKLQESDMSRQRPSPTALAIATPGLQKLRAMLSEPGNL